MVKFRKPLASKTGRKYTGWFKEMDSILYVYVYVYDMWNIYIKFDRESPNILHAIPKAFA